MRRAFGPRDGIVTRLVEIAAARHSSHVLACVRACVVPVLYQLCPRHRPLASFGYSGITLIGKYPVLRQCSALAVDLIWGYCGILEPGARGVFLRLGGYAMGMYLMRPIGAAWRIWRSRLAGFHGVPELARNSLGSGMGFNQSLGLRLLMVVLVPGRAGAGLRVVRLPLASLSGVYFSIITQAMTYALMLAFSATIWGSAAITASPTSRNIVRLRAPVARKTPVVLLVITVGWPSERAISFAARSSTRAPGKVIRAIRDAESRRGSSGIRVESLQALGSGWFSAMLAWYRRRAVRAPGRHHQPERIRAD